MAWRLSPHYQSSLVQLLHHFISFIVWLTSHWARGQPWKMVWERVGLQSRARDWREWALKVGWKYLAKAGQVRQVASHCLPKPLPTRPEGAQGEAREQKGRGKLKRGRVGNPTVPVSMPSRPRKGRCTCLRGAPAILGKHSPGRQNLITCCCCHLRQARGDCKMRKQSICSFVCLLLGGFFHFHATLTNPLDLKPWMGRRESYRLMSHHLCA